MKRPRPSAHYPVFLNIHGKRCVVIGGGMVALRKAKMLLDCGGNVTVVSPTLSPELERLAEAGEVSLVHRDYKEGDLKDSVVAIAATDARETNQRVADEARQQGVFVNVVDDPGQSDFIIPSYFRRGGLTIAVSTAGMSPALARKIRTRLEPIIGEEFALLLSIVTDVRSALKERGIRVGADAWQEALDLDLLIGLVRAGQPEKARALLLGKLEAHHGEK
jgi:siroheme synthase-like protein